MPRPCTERPTTAVRQPAGSSGAGMPEGGRVSRVEGSCPAGAQVNWPTGGSPGTGALVVVTGTVVVVIGGVVLGAMSTVDEVGVELVVVVLVEADVVLADVVLLGVTGVPTPVADWVRTEQPVVTTIEAVASQITSWVRRATRTVCQPIGRATVPAT